MNGNQKISIINPTLHKYKELKQTIKIEIPNMQVLLKITN